MDKVKPIYIYFLISVVGLLASCASDNPEPNVAKGGAVSFDVSDKVRATSTTNFTEFAVYGDVISAADNPDARSIVFNNTKVEYLEGNWIYSDTQYWLPESEHSFVAVSPLSVLNSDNNLQYSSSKLSFIYKTPSSAVDSPINPDDLKDVIVATHRRIYKAEDSNTTIHFTFGHIMSMINLAPAYDDNSLGADDYIMIRKVGFSGVKTEARIDLIPAPLLSSSQTDDMILDMTEEKTGNLTVALPDPVKVNNNHTNINLFADYNAIIMFPQDFAVDSASEITVYYTISEDPTIQRVTLPLQDMEWESSKSYCYKFTIERKKATFDKCEITPWNEIRGEDITVD